MPDIEESLKEITHLESELAVAEARQQDAAAELSKLQAELEAVYQTSDLGKLQGLLISKEQELVVALAEIQTELEESPQP